MKKLISIFLLFQFSVFLLKGQHPYFGSLNQQVLSLNPAFAGSNGQLRLQSYYSNVWPNFTITQNWYYVGADMLIAKQHGFGFNVYTYDMYKGAFRGSQASLSYAYHITVKNKIKIVPAFQASFFQFTQDFHKYPYPLFGSNYPYPTTYYISGKQTKYNFEGSGGVLIYQKNYHVGFSVLGFNQPDQGLLGVAKRPYTAILQGGYRFLIGAKGSVDTYGFFANQQNFNWEQFGVYFGYDNFKLHLATRLRDAVLGGFNYTYKGLRFGYNLILIISKLAGNIATTHDFYLSYIIKSKDKKELDEKGQIITLKD